MQLPKKFQEKMQELLGEDYPLYLKCFNEKHYFGLRVNTGKISVTDFLKITPWELTPIPWMSNGFYYDGANLQPAKHPYYHAGLYYLQEPSAMTPAYLLPIEAGDKVLDLCAAPGGKATELGARLGGTGLLVANDISNSRAKGLLKNIELMGIGNALVMSEDPEKFVNYFEGFFDKILIDAPCSGEGMFRKEPSMIKNWEEKGPEVYSQVQKKLILQGAKMLKAGGWLLYSTCTFDPRENEQVVEHLLNHCSEFSVVGVEEFEGFQEGLPQSINSKEEIEGFSEELPQHTKSKNEELKKTLRLYPHRIKGEGHYVALLKKSDRFCAENKNEINENEKEVNENEKEINEKEKKKSNREVQSGNVDKIPKELLEFLQLVKRKIEINQIYVKGEQVYYLPGETPSLARLRFLRTGLYLGDLKKKRFEPSQALAMNLGKEEFALSIDFKIEDQRVIKYLKGETLEVSDVITRSDKGWVLICVEGYPLGFGKLACQRVKNKVQSGWRMM